MKHNHLTSLLLVLPLLAWGKAEDHDPCLNMLAVIDRPTVADSACVVKSGKILVEAGLQFQDLYPHGGHAWQFPTAQFRFGLPANNEITVLAPTYTHQYGNNAQNNDGYGITSLGWKHQFVNLPTWGFSGETIFTLPTGSNAFGSDGLGFALNGIVAYNITDTVALALMLGYTTQTTAAQTGGERFQSVNPDLVFTWQCLEQLQLYAELYGQSNTGPDEHDGFNADAGVQYLVTTNIELDVEYGQRINGSLGGFARYWGIGAGFRF